MREHLLIAFPILELLELTDDYIECHPDLMWDTPPTPLINAVPRYMLWCIEHADQEGSLVFDRTISALNTYARVKDPYAQWLIFRFDCTNAQIEAVQKFLTWCHETLLQDYEPTLSRAMRNWQNLS